MSSSPRLRMAVDERKAHLVAFGREFFAEHPVDALSMDELAKRAGVSKGLLYHYFGGRRGFYVATIEAIADEVLSLTDPDPEGPFTSALEDALRRYIRFVRDNGAIYRALVEGGLGVDEQVAGIVEKVRRTTMDRVLSRLGAPSAGPEARVALYGWVCFAERACLEWLDADFSEDAMVTLLVDALTPALTRLAA